ncbi:MAG: polysaccharide deacetylase family protein, partial [Hyphomicrobium sp.]
MNMLPLSLKLKHMLLIGITLSFFVMSVARAEEVQIRNNSEDPKKSDVCSSSKDVLGVSRTIEIDTTNGPTLGSHLNKEENFLNDKEVILTFDDGPSRKYTETILDTLDAQCTKATFFIIGKSALLEPRIVQEIDMRGHTIAAHTWSHKRLDKIAYKKAKYEIELGFSAIERALGKPPSSLFRFPYLAESDELRKYLSGRNYSNTRINIDSRDFLTKNPSVVRKNVIKQLKSEHRGIILFHDIQPSTASALRSILN